MALTVKQLKEFLNDYDDNSEIIMGDGSEIKHIGMTNITDHGYSVVFAKNKPEFYCDTCGCEVYEREDEIGYGGYYCPTCGEIKHQNELIPIDEEK